MTLSRQERRRADKKKMNRPAGEPAGSPGTKRLPICNPAACELACELRNFGKEDRFPDHDEMLEKYGLAAKDLAAAARKALARKR